MPRHVRGSGRAAPAVRAAAAALLATLVLAAPLPAQESGTVRGRVVSAATGEPLAGVSVRVEGTGLRAETDARGAFRLTGVPPGTHRLVARRLGLGAERRRVEVAAGTVAEVEIRLSEEALLLPEVVVSASREAQRLGETAATVGVVSGAELRDARPAHPSDVMQRVPGVWVNVTGGEGHMTAIRQPMTTKPMYLFLEDGVPTRSTGFFNHNALYEVDLPQSARVEVLKGPGTALYGSDAIGGVVNVETRGPSLFPSAEVFAEAGAFGWARLLASASGTRGADGLRANANLTRTGGWRDGTAYDRQSATLRWDHDFGGGSTLRTVLTASRIDQQTAGSSALLREDYLERPTVNYTPVSLRNVRAVRLSGAFERRTASTLVGVTPFARWNEMELLPNWSLTYDPTIYTTGHASLGVLARLRHDVEPIRTRLIAGVDVDRSPGGRLEHRIDPVREGRVFTDYTRGEVLYDYDVVFRSVSPYLQAETSPTDRLHLTAGLRYDRIAYDYDSRLEPLPAGRWRRPADAEVRYDHLSPKLGAAYEVGPALNVYARYARGFRAPSEGQLFRQGSAASTVDLDPVVADSYEAGVRGRVAGRLGYTLAAYRMTVRNDILTYVRPDGVRETVNAGETRHRGIEAGLEAALTDELRADVAASLAEHVYEAWSPGDGVDYGGNEMEDAPALLASTRLSYAPGFLPGGRVALEWRRVGRYRMDAGNTHEYPGHDLWNLQADVPVTGSLELVGRLTNLTDERYAESASYTEFRGEEFAPGMPRAAYLGVQYRWRGGGR